MGRKSILTEEQWANIARRLMEGEAARPIALEHGISEAAVRAYFKRRDKLPTVQQAANKLVEAEAMVEMLPKAQQLAARSLASRLRNISESLACGAELGAKNFHRLNALANSELQKVDDINPLGENSAVYVRNAAALTKVGIDCAHAPLNLIAANKEAVKRFGEEPPGVVDEELTPERLKEGVRRLAFTLTRAATQPESH